MKKLLSIVLLMALPFSFAACEGNQTQISSDVSSEVVSSDETESMDDSSPDSSEETVYVPSGNEDRIRIVEWNLLATYYGGSSPALRIGGIDHMLKTYEPDICGFVECCDKWRLSLRGSKAYNENYSIVYNEKATSYRTTGMDAVVYRKDKYKHIEHGGYIYNDGRGDERGFTWAVLEEIANGRRILVVVTILAPEDNAVQTRVTEMEQLTEQIAELRKTHNYPLILLGDFNACDDEPGMAELMENNNVYMTRTAAENVLRDTNTIGGAERGWIIDFTFVDKDYFYPLTYSTMEDEVEGTSDHHPSYSDLLWKE